MNAVAPLRPRQPAQPAAAPVAAPEAAPAKARVRLQDYPIVVSNSPSNARAYIQDPQLRERLCLLTNDAGGYLLLVSQAHRNDHAVMSYETRLRRLLKIEAHTAYVTPDLIARAYEHGRAVASSDDTAERNWILRILATARDQDVQDVKLIVMSNHCRVRFISNGRGTNRDPLSTREGWKLIRTLCNSMTALKDFNPRVPQDANLRHEYAEQLGLSGVRIATRPEGDFRGINVTMRLLPKGTEKRSLAQSGYTAEQQAQIDACTEHQQGMVIVAGKTGSGKSTLLKSMLETIDRREGGELDIMTIEDPIEAPMVGHDGGPGGRGGGIVQTPLVKSDEEASERAWARDIPSLMRHAPRIIMPGEVRDKVSAMAAFDFAMSGHLAVTTFHAASAETILMRLDQWGVDRTMLLNASMVVALIHQTLCRRLCADCKQPLANVWDQLTDVQRTRYSRVIDVAKAYAVGANPNCPTCGGKGTSGRIVVAEIITPTIRFMEVFRDEGAIAARQYWMRDMGGLTRLQHVHLHINAGLVDPRIADRDVDPIDKELNLMGTV